MPGEARFCPSCGFAMARLTAGQTLDGKYEILEKIGEGGMGEVYKARHVHLDEIRIIKVTKPDALGEGPEPRRFQEEARLATLVRHPNVAALYDFSRLPDGSFYMVWEFIDGITLEQWLRKNGPLPLARALEVARQVLAGLSEIHAQGIVHRDLAPDNIMLRENRDGRLLAKVIDLGIAKRVASDALSMTGTGMFVGKLKYCSPEQAGALRPGEAVDARSDLYSFGVVLYEMLSGRPPFESQTPEEYLGKHLHTAPPPLDTASLPPRVGPPLAAVVARALEKRRERRFSDAREFAAALERLVPAADEPTVRVSTAEEFARSRSAIPWTAGAAVLLAVAAGLYLVNRRAASGPGLAPAPVSTAAPTLPTPVPTEGPDEVVVAPRIVEQRTPTPAPREEEPTPRPRPTRAAPPTAAPPPPTAVPEPAPPIGADALPGAALTADQVRMVLRNWSSRPVDRRAHRAFEIARAANIWVDAHPNDPFTPELKSLLPRMLKTETETALDRAQPVLAQLFYRAYQQLRFAPSDPDLDRRAGQMRPPGRRLRR